MSNGKVKGLLKGLRYISQIFENEKEAEMQIGHPTDVKHVAHIGWDGPSVNSPSWMNEFKTAPSISSPPLSLPAPRDIKDDVSVKWVPEDQRGEKGSNSVARSSPDVPKSSKHPSSIESPTSRERSERHKARHSSSTESPTSRERSERHKARRSSKSKEASDKKHGHGRGSDQNDSPDSSLPDIPRNGRRKKTSRSKPHAAETYKLPYSDPGSSSGTGSISISEDTELCQKFPYSDPGSSSGTGSISISEDTDLCQKFPYSDPGSSSGTGSISMSEDTDLCQTP